MHNFRFSRSGFSSDGGDAFQFYSGIRHGSPEWGEIR